MKTWKQLDDLAGADDLALFRRSGGVTIFTTVGFKAPLVTITPGELTTDADADRVVRVACEAALRELKGLPR
jgi:hypothetical protein